MDCEILVGEDQVSLLVVQALEWQVHVLEPQCWRHVEMVICCGVLFVGRLGCESVVGQLLCGSIGWSAPLVVVRMVQWFVHAIRIGCCMELVHLGLFD